MSETLDGITVVSLEQAVAAPYCSSRLADAGARVIKVERPEGDFARGYDRIALGQSAYFVWLNRGKQSIALDIKQPDEADLLGRMIAGADIFIQNLAPGAAARAGFDSAALRRKHPRLITCDISGYGESGPYARMKAYDLLVQAESGLASITGHAEGPGRVGVLVADIAAGMYAYMGILEALIARGKTGRGRGLAVSLFDGLAEWMTVPLLHQVYGGAAPARVGLNHPSIAPYGAYRTADGEILVAIQNEREWKRFCNQVLLRKRLSFDPRFVDNPARVANRPALDREIEAVFDDVTQVEVIARLRAADIAYGALNTPAELEQHPQLRRVEVETPAGAIELVAPPVRMVDETPVLGPVPELDQQGSMLREEFAR